MQTHNRDCPEIEGITAIGLRSLVAPMRLGSSLCIFWACFLSEAKLVAWYRKVCFCLDLDSDDWLIQSGTERESQSGRAWGQRHHLVGDSERQERKHTASCQPRNSWICSYWPHFRLDQQLKTDSEDIILKWEFQSGRLKAWTKNLAP